MKTHMLICILLLILSSCFTERVVQSNRNAQKVDSIKNILKNIAFVRCIDYCYPKRYGINDSLDFSLPFTYSVYSFGTRFYSFGIRPKIDSLAKEEYKRIDSRRFVKDVGEGAEGKTAYSLACLEFYHSRQLDSLSEEWAIGIIEAMKKEEIPWEE
ncbi:hypothetical protein ACF3OC_13090 [Sphingobacterium cellulitidis]|uniref:hypothetical protein n=1 Tax=Sphingobacterium cellulitidis TaxID=1768011 RepID=UPI00370D442D